MIEQVHEGQAVQTSDGVSLGTITRMWWGTEPVDTVTPCVDETCLEVQSSAIGWGGKLYIPCSAVASVSEQQVTLSFDAATAATKPWVDRPAWITDDSSKSLLGLFGLSQQRGA
ncbi:MAG TPA: hypothetical protein VGD58_11690 [Herpetosiphonaceae bacterium]